MMFFDEELTYLEKARTQMWASFMESHKMNKDVVVKIDPYIAFDTCVTQASNGPTLADVMGRPKKRNDNMYVEQNMTVKEKTTEDVRREHFLGELHSIFCKKENELQEKFGLSIPKSPKNPKELVEWIKAGDFTFVKTYDPEADEDEDDGWCRYDNPIHGIRWTKVKEDRKGYEEARKVLNAEETRFTNEIWAEVEPSNFIKILEKFEKTKLH
jgi:hypothetical protein